MELVFLVLLIALLEYLVFSAWVGRARATYAVDPPATTGAPAFERTYRVQQNTLESLIVFVPAIWLFGLYVQPLVAAALGVVFVVGRAIYALGYIKAAEKRGPGAVLTALANGVLVVGALVGVIAALF